MSGRAAGAADAFAPVREFFETRQRWMADRPEVCDFTFGNPHEMPLPGLVAALRRSVEPRARTGSPTRPARRSRATVIAEALRRELGLAFEPEDVALTQGAFGAIALAFRLVMDARRRGRHPGAGLVLLRADAARRRPRSGQGRARARPLRPRPRGDRRGDHAPDPDGGRQLAEQPHRAASTRAHLAALADLLEAASRRIGARIWLLSDEPYRRIRLDGNGFTSPAALYPWTLIDYSYGKVLLAPGQRLGYLALSPLLPARERAGAARGALPDPDGARLGLPRRGHAARRSPALETVSIDLDALTARRDRLLGALERWGYRVTRPEGTFYLWAAAPGGDAVRFAETLAARDVFVMPGTLFERPQDFRISLTATAEMIERALPAFRDAAGPARDRLGT